MSERAANDSPVDPPIIEVTVGAPIETVWTYLREPDLIRSWHGWLTDGLDTEIDFIYRQHARESDSPYVLETDRSSEGPWMEGGDRFELHESNGGTTVRITRGARGPGEEMWGAWYEDITEGWTSFLHQLRFAIERHPAGLRRTVFLNADGAGLISVREALGLSGLAVGDSYVTDSDGLDLHGQGWFVAAHQTGVIVDSLGPGLVVAADKPDGHGVTKGAMAIVTTYGQNDTDFARTVGQWGDWWQVHYPGAEGPQT